MFLQARSHGHGRQLSLWALDSAVRAHTASLLLPQVRLTPFATRLVTDMAYLRSARGAPPESPKVVEPEFKHKPGSITFPYEDLKRARSVSLR